MLASLRSGLNTWPARLFFMFLVALFVAWGVGGDVLRLITGGASDGSVASVGNRRIDMPELLDAYRRQLAQVMRMFGGRTDPTPEIRRAVAQQALSRLITQAALTEEADTLGLTVSDEALRQAVFQVPAFRGTDGRFDRAVFEQTLRNNNLTEPRFLALLRLDLLQRQLLEPVRAGANAPDILTRQVFAFQQEKRVADAVDLPFSAAAAPPAPTEAQLTRWYENHKDLYATPEFRRIKAVILSPDTVVKDMQVTEDDLRGAYEQMRSTLNLPEKRSAEVVLLADEAKARALTAQWQGSAGQGSAGQGSAGQGSAGQAGADWPSIQAAATKAGGSPVDLPDSTREQIPAPELADAIFAAEPGAVAPPVKTALGWYALKVTQVTPGTSKTLDQARDELRARVVAEKAADLIYDRANKVEDLLAGGVGLESLPGDLGLAAVTGTLDAQGTTPAGQPAPIPGTDELRAALIQAAFQMKKGDPARLTQAPAEGGGGAFFAVVVEDIVPPAPRPQAEVADRAREDWTRDAIRHAREEAAAKILAAVKGGQKLADAAAGQPVAQLPPVGRAGPAQGVPAQLVTPLFTLKPGEPTMVETADGFVVAVLRDVQTPDPAADPIGYGQVRDALNRAVAGDMENVFASAVRDRARPTVNRPALESLTKSE
jgi:peptidyl-prolyl cis-trans isomerase D